MGNQENEFDAVITRAASMEMSKSNGGIYVLHTAKITSGVLAGKTVTCSRTLKNKEGEIKSPVKMDQEVTLYATVVTDAQGNAKPFFEIQSGSAVAEDAELLSLLGVQAIN